MATEVLVPPLGQTVDTVTLVCWYREEGQTVTRGEMLFAIETDKATLDIEAPASGVLRRVRAAPGDEVKVLSAVAVIAAADESLEGAPAMPGAEPVRGPGMVSVPIRQVSGDGRPQRSRERTFISPRARRLAEEHDVPWAAVEPTGPEGAIVERDVRAYLQAKEIRPGMPSARSAAKAGEMERSTVDSTAPDERAVSHDAESQEARVGLEVAEMIPVMGVRAVIADRMSQSALTTARVTLNADADAAALVDMQHQLSQDGIDVSYSDLLLYILGRVLREHPRVNASLEGDAIKVWRQIHIGLAVDTARGLLVPVVHDADRKSLTELAAETRSLIERARAAQCSPRELSGGTFTLTNLGMFGIDSFTPIINLPECAILGMGRIKKQPAVVGDGIVVRRMVWLSLTFDHRLVDGAPAARFLQRVVQLIEHPYLLLA